MSTKGRPELDYIISPLTGRTFEFNQGGVRLLEVFGLGMPRMSTNDEIIKERSVYQHGSTVTSVRLPPAREWGMVMDITGASSRQEYWDLRELLIRTFNPARTSKCGFEVPTPLQYTKVLPNGQKRHLDFFYRSGLFDSRGETVDGRYEQVTVRLTSADPTLYADEEEIDYAPSQLVESSISGRKRFIIDESVLPNLYENKGSWCGCPVLEFDVNFNTDSDFFLSGIIIKNVTTSEEFAFRNVNYPAGGWGPVLGSGSNSTVLFDVCERVLQVQNSLGIWTTGLELNAQPTTDWANFTLTPEDEFVFGIEFIEPTAVTIDNINFKYVPRFVGI